MKAEILRLFKGFLGEKSEIINQAALNYGLIIPATADKAVVEAAINLYGKDGSLWNQTFHKSWDKVANAPMMQLVLEQIMHYFTTYGFEALGLYSEDSIYIPAEKLDVPGLEVDKIKLISIKALTEAEVSAKLMSLITSGIALSDQTIADIKVLSDFIDKDRFDEVANREVRTFLYDKYNIMPKNPEAFLRYLMFKVTGATLKIQNVPTYNALRYGDKELILKMLEAYGDYAKLSSIFLRNKNLFLALKVKQVEGQELTDTAKAINKIINKLRKLATINHKALKPALLDTLTSRTDYTEEDIISALDNVSLFRAVRLMNTLAYRLNGNNDIVYRVRNGKSYVSNILPEGSKYNDKKESSLRLAYNTVKNYIISKLTEKVKDKTVYIPDGITYKAPTSEKQFVGNIPEGSYFELSDGKDLIFAIHWVNLNEDKSEGMWNSSPNRVDLDMHMLNNSEQFGWNNDYRDENSRILFSGDVTSAPAPLGATEAYSISHLVRNQSYLVTVNDFNCHNEDVPFEFIVAEDEVEEYGRRESLNYMIDPNKIINKFDMKISPDKRQITLGMVKADEKTKRFYFNDYAVGPSCTVTTRNNYTLGALSYMKTYNEVQVTLNELLIESGAKIYNTPDVPVILAKAIKNEQTGKVEVVHENTTVPADIDLSIENIDKTSLIELFTK